jgi:predicted acetyltransferase
MEIAIRSITDDEFVEYEKAMGVGFGYQPSDDAIEHSKGMFERDRSVAAFDAGRIVATAGVYTLDLTVPGLSSVTVGGVTAVSVMPTHRRQGILTRMMAKMLDDIVERGEPLAMLWASESIIYGRFGYGLAASGVTFEIERDHAALARPVRAPGRIRAIDKDTASKVLPDAFERFRRTQPGAVSRPAGWWNWHWWDPEWDRGGASPRFFLIHETPKGVVDGYASYRVKSDWSNGGSPGATARIGEVIGADPATRTALWQMCLDLDLTSKIQGNVPVDEPLRWQLADPRRFSVSRVSDNLWVRLLDVGRSLSSRTYASEGHVVFEVADRTRADVAGRYELEGGPSGATSKRSRRKADLALDIADLGAMYLGGIDATTLARAGRVEELTKGALARADAMLASHPAPWCNTDF